MKLTNSFPLLSHPGLVQEPSGKVQAAVAASTDLFFVGQLKQFKVVLQLDIGDHKRSPTSVLIRILQQQQQELHIEHGLHKALGNEQSEDQWRRGS